MQSALRPYVTAGVALVGASAIAVSPVTVPPSAVEKVQDAAVELSALDNPIDTLRPIFEQALREAREVGATIADNPAPILEQLLKNQVGNFVGLPAAIGAQLGVPLQLPQILGDVGQNELANLGNIAVLSEGLIANIVATLTSTDPTGLQGSLLSAFEAIGNNDLGSAFQFLFTAALVGVAGNGLETLTNLILLGQTLGEPVEDAAKLLPIVGGPLNNVASVIEALPGAALGVGIGPILSAGGAAETIGDDVSDIITAAQAGDAEAAFNHFVALSGVTTKVTLDSLVGPLGVLAGLQNLPRGHRGGDHTTCVHLRGVEVAERDHQLVHTDRAGRKGTSGAEDKHAICGREVGCHRCRRCRVGHRHERHVRPGDSDEHEGQPQGRQPLHPRRHLHKGWQASRRHRKLRPGAAGHHQGAHRPRSR